MANHNIQYNQYNKYSYYLPQRIGPGALPNDQVKHCYKCRKPIQFRKRSDNKGWQLLDYFTGQPHQHRGEEEAH
jgi:hypothetical protein